MINDTTFLIINLTDDNLSYDVNVKTWGLTMTLIVIKMIRAIN